MKQSFTEHLCSVYKTYSIHVYMCMGASIPEIPTVCYKQKPVYMHKTYTCRICMYLYMQMFTEHPLCAHLVLNARENTDSWKRRRRKHLSHVLGGP